MTEIARRIAVVTDAVSSKFYFDTWFKYYSKLFGSNNIYVITLAAESDSFLRYNLGRIIPVEAFNNTERVNVINNLVAKLLDSYDIVCRVDTDEFLVADPREFLNLAEYLNQLDISYVTAYGFNVIPDRDQPALDLDKPILFHQRNLAYPYNALFKTCVTSKAIRWTPGFHFCSERPLFDRLFLFHTKLADLDVQIAIGAMAARASDEERFAAYHRTSREILEQRLNAFWGYSRLDETHGFYRTKYVEKFLDNIKYADKTGIYHGQRFEPESVLLQITSEFRATF